MIRILIVDDHPIVREGLVSIVNAEDDLDVIGQAANGKEAVEFALEHRPDVVLMDLRMPVMDGVEAIRRLREESPASRVVVLTTYDTDELVYDAIRAGARGYLLKDVTSNELTKAIRTVYRGGSLLQPVVVERLLDRLGPGDLEQSAPFEALTPRELEVLQCMSTGARNREIAEELVIAERTVKIHVANVIAKLGATNRTEAVVTALDLGIIRRGGGDPIRTDG